MGAGNTSEDIQYSQKYFDDIFEYRHVILPSDIAKLVPRTHLLTESEWRNLGVQQSPGWINYMSHIPEPHVLLFRRLRTDSERDPQKAIKLHVQEVNNLTYAAAKGKGILPVSVNF